MSIYAIILDRNKQYYIKEGLVFKIDFLNVDVGNVFYVNNVLCLLNKQNVYIGTPFVEGSFTQLQVLKHVMGEKMHILKFRRRKHFKKMLGYRHKYTLVKSVLIK